MISFLMTALSKQEKNLWLEVEIQIMILLPQGLLENYCGVVCESCLVFGKITKVNAHKFVRRSK